MLNPEIMNELENITEQVQETERKKMLYKGCKTTYDFERFTTVMNFGDAITNSIITVDMANDEQQ